MLTALWEAGILDWSFVASKTDSMGGHHGISGFCLPPSPPPKKCDKTGSPFQLTNPFPSGGVVSIWGAPLSQPLIQARPLGPLGHFFPKDHNDHQRRPQFFGRWTLELKIFQKSCGCFGRFQVMTWKYFHESHLEVGIVWGTFPNFHGKTRRSLFRVDVPKDSPGNMKLMVRWFLAKGQAVKPILRLLK